MAFLATYPYMQGADDLLIAHGRAFDLLQLGHIANGQGESLGFSRRGARLNSARC